MANREDVLLEFFRKGQDAYAQEAESSIRTDRIIAFGPGALVGWGRGRKLFYHLFTELSERFQKSGNFGTTTFHWLGYPLPDTPYSIVSTGSSLVDTAVSFSTLLNRHIHTKRFDIICHSLMGLAAVYWATEVLPVWIEFLNADWDKEIRVITINSPLRGSGDYASTVRRLNAEFKAAGKSTRFFGSEELPPVIAELDQSSRIMSKISDVSAPLPGFYLYTIRTKEDLIVLEKDATCGLANDTYLATNVKPKMGLSPHISALYSKQVIRAVSNALL